jgi:hypothetical protein
MRKYGKLVCIGQNRAAADRADEPIETAAQRQAGLPSVAA